MTEATTSGVPLPRLPHGGPGQPPLGDSGHRGDYGEQFVRALAAAANLDASRRDRDRTGVDWNLGYPGQAGTRMFPAIDVQVKCWSNPNDDPHTLRYPLRVKNYNWLAGRIWQLPRFLFLVIAPKAPSDWVDLTPDHLLMRHAAYWACFHESEPLAEEVPQTSTYTVDVPRGNLLTLDALYGLFAEDFREALVAS